MKAAIEECSRRMTEVSSYIDFVMLIESGYLSVDGVDFISVPSGLIKAPDRDVVKTLKAASYLLLYNLLESTAKNALQELFDELHLKRVSIDDCIAEFRLAVFRLLKKKKPDDVVGGVKVIAEDLIRHVFDKDSVFSGNVDARVLRDTFKEYGVSPLSFRMETDKVVLVKNRRNDLAHGDFSFVDIGKDMTIHDLIETRSQVFHVLEIVLGAFEDFINEKRYLSKCRE